MRLGGHLSRRKAGPEVLPGSAQGLHALGVKSHDVRLCTRKIPVLTWEEAQLKNCVRERYRARSPEESLCVCSGGNAANSRRASCGPWR